jgi:tight adherence protein B
MLTILILIGLVLIVGGSLVMVGVDRERLSTARRLKQLAAPPSTKAVGEKPENVRGDPWLPYVPVRLRPWIEDKLASTGYTIQLRAFIALIVGGFVLSLLFGFLLHFGASVYIISIVLISLLPSWILLKWMQGRHTSRFLDQFPDAIDLIVRAVRAGLPVVGALEATGRETPDPVGMEFRLITADLRIGIEFDEALRRADTRIKLADFSFFVASLILQRESGGNLSETLSILSAVLRRRRELRLKIAAMTSEAKTSAMVIASLPFVAMGALSIMNPSYVNTLFTDPKGPWIIGTAAALLGIGWLTMSTLIKNAVR